MAKKKDEDVELFNEVTKTYTACFYVALAEALEKGYDISTSINIANSSAINMAGLYITLEQQRTNKEEKEAADEAAKFAPKFPS